VTDSQALFRDIFMSCTPRGIFSPNLEPPLKQLWAELCFPKIHMSKPQSSVPWNVTLFA
jgi:hypothetical protein